MANQSITDFIKNFGGGTRTNRFNIIGTIGGSGTSVPFNDFHIRAASLPSAQVGPIEIKYRGRSVLYPGDRAYLPWDIMVLDENPNEKRVTGGKTIYGAFHTWHESINSHSANTSLRKAPDSHFSRSVWNVNQLDVNGTGIIRTFTLHNCWPLMVGPLELNMDKDNSLGSFMVRILFSHYTNANARR